MLTPQAASQFKCYPSILIGIPIKPSRHTMPCHAAQKEFIEIQYAAPHPHNQALKIAIIFP